MAALPEVSPHPQEQRAVELRTMFEWIAKQVGPSEPEVLDVGFQVPIAGRNVHLQRVVQWSLSGKRLRLSVPVEHRDEIEALLAMTRGKGGIDTEVSRSLAKTWDLVAGEFMTPAHTKAEPAVLLAHRGSSQGMLLATWPTREALEAFHAMQATQANPLKPGERVEVAYDGKWYAGILECIDSTGKAAVACDADAPGVMTLAPLNHVRRPNPTSTTPQRQQSLQAQVPQQTPLCPQPQPQLQSELPPQPQVEAQPSAPRVPQVSQTASQEHLHREQADSAADDKVVTTAATTNSSGKCSIVLPLWITRPPRVHHRRTRSLF